MELVSGSASAAVPAAVALDVAAEDRCDAAVAMADRALARVDAELSADAVRRLQLAVSRMERFLGREEHVGGRDDPTHVLARRLIEDARRLVRTALAESRTVPRESTLRSAYRLAGCLSSLAAWSAPASQESVAINSFPVAAERNAVAYSRYGCEETAAQEAVYASLLGVDPKQSRLLLTSSGMAAYGLIENFLLREVLRPQDRVLLHPGVYFETQQQIRTLPQFEVETAPGSGRHDMLRAIADCQPRAVLIDPLSNSRDLRMIDLPRLLDEAAEVCLAPTWFIVDGTLLSGCLDRLERARRNVRVLYYESGCKYLQFGLDLGPAGIVVVERALAARFERLRRGAGAIAAECTVLPRASRDAYLQYLGVQTACATTVAQAVAAVASMHSVTYLKAAFPAERTHPDHAEALRYPHAGGVVAFRFTDVRLNRRRPLEAFIDLLMAAARAGRVPLTAGVSFGFRVPRIGAAWTGYDEESAFLRLSAGASLSGAERLGELIANCAARFAEA